MQEGLVQVEQGMFCVLESAKCRGKLVFLPYTLR